MCITNLYFIYTILIPLPNFLLIMYDLAHKETDVYKQMIKKP
jgi:hypothetical protein